MEVDLEELGMLLYPNGVPESEDFEKYLLNLASCGVEKLLREGSHLKEERNLVLEETRNFVYQNYKTFIHSADCSKAIYQEFNDIENNLESLISGLPELKLKVDDFLAASRSLSQSRQATSLTLSKHTQLLEILELPQLMETCVRNGYYEDSLDILSYVKRLEKKHVDIPLIISIVSEVKGGTRLMLLQLLMQLRSSLTLPQCLKTVGYLRRLDVFSDAELRVKFLQARDSWFNGMVKAVPKEDAFQHISKVVELFRVHLFDIVTQYRAIFSDEDARFNLGETDVNEQIIFHGWIVHKVNQFIKMLEKDLQRDVGPNMESLLDQCMFFGQSFSRIGADFRSLLIPVFQDAIFKKFESDVQSANFKFDESLSSFSLMDSLPLQPSALLPDSQDKTNPPLSLMEFHPLACYANGIVASFNGLRLCCPLALLKRVLGILSSSFFKVVTALLDLHQIESSGFTANEGKLFSRMCFLLSSALVPHINLCLRYLFPLQVVAKVTGRPIVELQKQNTGQLDTETLVAPLEKFIPPKPLTTEFESTSLPEVEGKENNEGSGLETSENKQNTPHSTDDYDNVLINFDKPKNEESLMKINQDVEENVEIMNNTDTDLRQVPKPASEENSQSPLFTSSISSEFISSDPITRSEEENERVSESTQDIPKSID